MRRRFPARAVAPAVMLVGALGCSGAWAQTQAPDQAQLAEGKLLFQKQANPACATCHTLKDAGSTGAIGPNLDDTGPSKDDIRGVLHSGLGAMPQFDDHLSKEQIDALVNYVFWATHPH